MQRDLYSRYKLDLTIQFVFLNAEVFHQFYFKACIRFFHIFHQKKPLKTMENAFSLAKKNCFDSSDIRYFLLPSVRFLPLLFINKFTGEADER